MQLRVLIYFGFIASPLRYMQLLSWLRARTLRRRLQQSPMLAAVTPRSRAAMCSHCFVHADRMPKFSTWRRSVRRVGTRRRRLHSCGVWSASDSAGGRTARRISRSSRSRRPHSSHSTRLRSACCNRLPRTVQALLTCSDSHKLVFKSNG